MKITNVIKEPVFGNTVTARLYQPIKPSSNWIIWLHGMGETGPADGSELNDVEKLPGFPKFAKGVRPGETTERGTIEYPFNIYAVQTESSYSFEKAALATYLAAKKKAAKLGMVGISMGGFGVMESLFDFYDLYNNIDFAINCCGSVDVAKTNRVRNVPILWWHGDKDTVVKYSDPVKGGAVEASNALKSQGKPVEFITLPGVGHNAWDKAFTLAPDDKSLAFVNQMFAASESSTVTTGISVSDYNLAIDKIVAAASALKK